MAEHILKQILAKSGVVHPGEERAETASMLQMQTAEIQRQFDSGRITRAVGLDATRHVMEAALEEVINDPAAYRAAREAGQIDAARQAIAGWDDTLSDEAAAQKRRDAFNVTLANRADDFLQANAVAPDDYVWVQERLDPGSIADARARAGYDQTVGIDETPRDLNERETSEVAATAWYKRHGLLADRQPDAPEETDSESSASAGSDWSEDRLERFFALRTAEREAQLHPDEPRDPSVRSITSGSAAFYNLNDDQ
jgi:hypothetical protein